MRRSSPSLIEKSIKITRGFIAGGGAASGEEGGDTLGSRGERREGCCYWGMGIEGSKEREEGEGGPGQTGGQEQRRRRRRTRRGGRGLGEGAGRAPAPPRVAEKSESPKCPFAANPRPAAFDCRPACRPPPLRDHPKPPTTVPPTTPNALLTDPPPCRTSSSSAARFSSVDDLEGSKVTHADAAETPGVAGHDWPLRTEAQGAPRGRRAEGRERRGDQSPKEGSAEGPKCRGKGEPRAPSAEGRERRGGQVPKEESAEGATCRRKGPWRGNSSPRVSRSERQRLTKCMYVCVTRPTPEGSS